MQLKNIPGIFVRDRVEYVQWAVNVVAGLRGSSGHLDELFDEVVAMANEKLAELD